MLDFFGNATMLKAIGKMAAPKIKELLQNLPPVELKENEIKQAVLITEEKERPTVYIIVLGTAESGSLIVTRTLAKYNEDNLNELLKAL